MINLCGQYVLYRLSLTDTYFPFNCGSRVCVCGRQRGILAMYSNKRHYDAPVPNKQQQQQQWKST